MKIVFASRTGNVQSLIESLDISNPLHVIDGSESIDDEYILFTYTDGYGDIPYELEGFLANHGSLMRAVLVSGDRSYGDAYCSIGEIIAEQYGIECLYKFENAGTAEDRMKIQKILQEFK